MIVTLFIFMITLLLIHEMDAIRTKEWRMFIVLKDMPDEKAYKIFTLAHIPLYFIAIFVMVRGGILANTVQLPSHSNQENIHLTDASYPYKPVLFCSSAFGRLDLAHIPYSYHLQQ